MRGKYKKRKRGKRNEKIKENTEKGNLDILQP
jgi:hypothetical protein